MAMEQQALTSQFENAPTPVGTQFSLRDGMTILMGDLIRKHHDVIAHILDIKFPDGVVDPDARIAYLFAFVMLATKDGRILQDPTQAVTEAIKNAERDGLAYTVEEQDSMAMYALESMRFWNGRKSSSVCDVFWSMLYDGADYVFEGIAKYAVRADAACERQARENARKYFVYDFRSDRREEILSGYDAKALEAKVKFGQEPRDLKARMQELVKAEQAAVDEAYREWRGLYQGDIGSDPTPRTRRLKEQSDVAWDRYEELQDVLHKAERERCPEYFEMKRKNEESLKAAIKAAEKERDDAIAALEAEANAEFERRYPAVIPGSDGKEILS